MISIVLPLTVKIVLNLISQSYTRSRIFCGMFFYFELHSKLDWGGFFPFSLCQWWQTTYSKCYFYHEGQEIFLGEIILIMIIIYFWIWYVSSMLLVNVYLIIYLHQTSSFSVVHTYSGPLTIILVTITVSAKIREKNQSRKISLLLTNCRRE